MARRPSVASMDDRDVINQKFLQSKINCVVLGDDGVGKGTLLSSYANHIYNDQGEYIMHSSEHYTVNSMVDNLPISLDLCTSIDASSFTNPNVFLIVFSIGNASSLKSTKDNWIKQIHRHHKHVPAILVGMKQDLRENGENRLGRRKVAMDLITYTVGLSAAKDIRAVRYLECSAETFKGVGTVFDEAVRVALFGAKPLKS